MSGFWQCIGFEPNAHSVIHAIHEGLPYSFFTLLAHYYGISGKSVAAATGIPETTRRRRASNGRFKLHESDRLHRLARVLTTAESVFGGDLAEVRRWFNSPTASLGGERPIDRIKTLAEAEAVFDYLLNIDHGISVGNGVKPVKSAP